MEKSVSRWFVVMLLVSLGSAGAVRAQSLSPFFGPGDVICDVKSTSVINNIFIKVARFAGSETPYVSVSQDGRLFQALQGKVDFQVSQETVLETRNETRYVFGGAEFTMAITEFVAKFHIGSENTALRAYAVTDLVNLSREVDFFAVCQASVQVP